MNTFTCTFYQKLSTKPFPKSTCKRVVEYKCLCQCFSNDLHWISPLHWGIIFVELYNWDLKLKAVSIIQVWKLFKFMRSGLGWSYHFWFTPSHYEHQRSEWWSHDFPRWSKLTTTLNRGKFDYCNWSTGKLLER